MAERYVDKERITSLAAATVHLFFCDAFLIAQALRASCSTDIRQLSPLQGISVGAHDQEGRWPDELVHPSRGSDWYWSRRVEVKVMKIEMKMKMREQRRVP